MFCIVLAYPLARPSTRSVTLSGIWLSDGTAALQIVQKLRKSSNESTMIFTLMLSGEIFEDQRSGSPNPIKRVDINEFIGVVSMVA